MPPVSVPFGPGTLTLGDTGALMDVSCQVENVQLTWDKSKDDDVTMLCGDVVAGATTLTAKLGGTMLLDLGTTGVVDWTYQHRGQSVPFEFVPNTAAGYGATGTVVIVPLPLGSTDAGQANMTGDFEYDCVGEPVYGPATP